MYQGKRECKGCGTSGTEKRRTKAGDLCFDCKKALKVGYAALNKVDDNRYMKVVTPWYTLKAMLMKLYDEDQHLGYSQKRTGDLPYISGKSEASSHQLTEDFNDLVRSMSIKDVGDKKKVGEIWCMDAKDACLLPSNQAIRLYRFINSLSLFTNKVKSESYKDMKTWLFNLNSGKVSLDDFESYTKRNIT